jgi:hypothetical protein
MIICSQCSNKENAYFVLSVNICMNTLKISDENQAVCWPENTEIPRKSYTCVLSVMKT